MGNKLLAGGGGSKHAVTNSSWSSSDMKRIVQAFKNLAGPGDYISREQFLADVFGGFLPFSFGNRLYDAFGGTRKGVGVKDLTDGLSLFITSDHKMRSRFIFRFYANDLNAETLCQDDFLRKLHEDQEVPPTINSLFKNGTIVDLNTFSAWLQNHPDDIDLYRFLNQGLSFTAVPEKIVQSFHQVLAGITHFSEENVATLERTFWQLVNSSPTHQFDSSVFVRVVSPPLSPDVAKLLFTSFDDRKDNIIDLRELAAGISAACYGPVVERTKFIFRLFDVDEDDLLKPDEIDLMLAALLKSHVLTRPNSSSSSSGSVIFLLSDITNIRDNILSTTASLSDNKTASGLNLEQFLQWTLTCSLHQPFLELLFQVCHVAFGVKPEDRKAEGPIVRSYLDRSDATELIPGDTIYLVPLNWWMAWCSFVGLRVNLQLPRSQTAKLSKKSTFNNSSSNLPFSFQSSKELYEEVNDASSDGQTEETSMNRELSLGSLIIDASNSDDSAFHRLNKRPVLRLDRFMTTDLENKPQQPTEPGPIDTSLLLSNTQHASDQHKMCLTVESCRPLRIQMAPFVPGFGFEILPPSVWLAFQSWYGLKQGASPVFRRVVVNSATSMPEIEYQPVRLIFIRQLQAMNANNNSNSNSNTQPAGTSSLSTSISSIPFVGQAASLVKSVFSATNVCTYPGVAPYNPPQPVPIHTLSADVSNNCNGNTQQSQIPPSPSGPTNGLPNNGKYYDAAYGYYSRCNTIGDVIKTFLGRFRLSQDSIRLWHLKSGSIANGKRSMVWSPGQLESATLVQAFAIAPDNLNVLEFRVLIEVANADLTWPEDAFLESASISGRDSPRPVDAQSINSVGSNNSSSTVGLIGFQNLGNTCFLNAALQCLSNTPALTRYFLRNIHLHELNMANPIGFHGLVALRYAELIAMVWTSGSPKSNQKPLSPAKIKNLIAKTWRQFGDSDQQDAQELMTFLLDGLHEDLNRKRRPPPAPTENGHLPNGVMNGQETATTEEKTEAAALKGAQLAWKNHLEMNNSVIVDLFHGLLSSEIKCPQCNNASTTFDPFSYLVLPLPVDRKQTLELTVIFLDATKPPLRIGIRVPVGSPCREIYEQSGKVLFGKTANELVEDSFLLAEVFNATIVRFYGAADTIGQQVIGELVLYELVSANEKNGHVDDSLLRHCHTGEKFISQCQEERCRKRFQLYNQLFVPIQWRDRFFIVINRQQVAVQKYVLPQLNWRPQLFGRPYLVPIPHALKDAGEFRGRLYDDVWERAQRFLTMSSKQDPKCAVVPNSGGNYARDGDFPPEKPFPFELCCVAGPHGQRCSVCPWMQFCQGCAISYSKELFGPEGDENTAVNMEELGGPFLAINWDPRTVFLCFSHQAESYVQVHESVEICRKKATEPLSLYDCLGTFSQSENVDGYNCEKKDCPSKTKNESTNTSTVIATSRMCLSRLPPMLIVHLKRFFMARDGRWMKSSRQVNVPISDLNLTDYVEQQNEQQTMNNEGCRYNLYAAICHYGAMRSGHYVTYAKHQPSGVWYFFDDTSVKEVQPSEIDMSAVYLLFFERVGLEYDSLLPKIDETTVPTMTTQEAFQAAEEAEQQRLAEVKARGLQNGESSATSGRCILQ